jgi:hypothetical protein
VGPVCFPEIMRGRVKNITPLARGLNMCIKGWCKEEKIIHDFEVAPAFA